jgi:deferrochelatase/peroxidase EfeB
MTPSGTTQVANTPAAAMPAATPEPKPDPRLLQPSDYADIQRLVLRGTTMPHLRYHLLTITSPVAARRFIGSLLTGELTVRSAKADFDKEEAASRGPDHHLYLGLTYRGLEALKLPTASLRSFPNAFREGAKARAASLRDPIAEPDWKFNHDATHIVVMLYARTADRLRDLSAEIATRAAAAGCGVFPVDGELLPDLELESGQVVTRPVHFGYRDGVSQPQLLPVESPRPNAPPPVLPGTFILGHQDPPLDPPQAGVENAVLANEPLPLPTLMTHNGTYGAFLMMEQDCDAFEAFLRKNSSDTASRELLAARLCGRWQNGVPLSLSPVSPLDAHGAPSVGADALNDFDYASATPALDDRQGLKCPIGAHIRRSNPRSSEVLGSMGGKVRLIRRGMPYGPPHDPKRPHDGKERGMLGLFLCASLQHQFEFMMRSWTNDGLFARGLDPAERDPFSTAQAQGGTFTYLDAQGQPVHVGMPRFIKNRGAAYLFFPSLTGLGLIAHTNDSKAADAPAVTAAIAKIVEATEANMEKRSLRDAHPKHHALLKASFEIDASVPENLRVGLFARPGRYTAYVRFSNGMPTPQPDAEPDIRGMAIKLFDVEGPKASEDEKRTHDFVMASHPVFFVPDAASYLDFFGATTQLEKAKRFPEIPKIFIRIANPLTASYFSQTPYALGSGLPVKYSVAPIPVAGAPADPPMAAADPDFLRKVLAEHLRKSEAKFAFFVQQAPDAEAVGIDDATVPWTTLLQKVATLTIPMQAFDAPAQVALAETISFNPWHSLLEHQPVGSINLARRKVYPAASRLRHENQGAPMREPDGKTDF